MSLEAPPDAGAPVRRGGRQPTPQPGVMSFWEHLEELRSTLISVLVIAGLAAVGGWFVSQPALDVLVSPALEKVYFSSPSEALMVRLKVSALVGLLVALPIIVARLWRFVAPGLFQHEKRAVIPVLVSGTLLFYTGVAFCYLFIVPKTVSVLLSFAGARLSPLINVTQYFGFVARFCLAFGLAFQLPLIIVLLAALGLLSPQQLWRQWRYGVVVIWILAAWLTPGPDIMSQIMMGAPLTLLYLLSLLLAFVFARRRRRRGL